jgi:hypothetical protein
MNDSIKLRRTYMMTELDCRRVRVPILAGMHFRNAIRVHS